MKENPRRSFIKKAPFLLGGLVTVALGYEAYSQTQTHEQKTVALPIPSETPTQIKDNYFAYITHIAQDICPIHSDYEDHLIRTIEYGRTSHIGVVCSSEFSSFALAPKGSTGINASLQKNKLTNMEIHMPAQYIQENLQDRQSQLIQGLQATYYQHFVEYLENPFAEKHALEVNLPLLSKDLPSNWQELFLDTFITTNASKENLLACALLCSHLSVLLAKNTYYKSSGNANFRPSVTEVIDLIPAFAGMSRQIMTSLLFERENGSADIYDYLQIINAQLKELE